MDSRKQLLVLYDNGSIEVNADRVNVATMLGLVKLVEEAVMRVEVLPKSEPEEKAPDDTPEL